MIEKHDAYVIKCDRCKEYLEDGVTEGTPFCFSEDEIISLAYDCDWIEQDGKFYCNVCRLYVERKDE